MNFVKINVVIDSKLEYWEVKLYCQKIIFDEKLKQMNKKSDKFSIRKLTIGSASVLIGTVFYLNNGGNVVQAADDVPNQPATQVEKNINQKTVGKVSTDTATSTLKADNT